MAFMLIESVQNQPSRFPISVKTFRKIREGILAEKFATKSKTSAFPTRLPPASTSNGVNHSLVKCQGSSRTYVESEDFSPLSFVGILAKNFAKKPKIQGSPKMSPPAAFKYFRWFKLLIQKHSVIKRLYVRSRDSLLFLLDGVSGENFARKLRIHFFALFITVRSENDLIQFFRTLVEPRKTSRKHRS